MTSPHVYVRNNIGVLLMKSAIATRVQEHRERRRHKGLKLVQIWVPDVNSKGFSAECKRQALLAKNSESEHDIHKLIDETADLRGWE